MPDTMVERVARAIAERVAILVPSDSAMQERRVRFWEMLSAKEKADYLAAARHVIGAMREPTEAMERAAYDHSHEGAEVLGGWRAMIESALVEEA